MSKLTVELVKQSLLEKDEIKKVSAQKLKLSKHRKAGEVKNIKDPSLKMTKIKQVEVPKEEGKKSDKGGSFIPQADFANKYTDKMPHGQGPGGGKGGSNQKSPKITAAKSMKPNQQTKLKAVQNSIKGTDDDGTQKAAALPPAKFASEYTDSMPHGNEVLGSGNNEGGEGQSDPSVSKMAGGPTRAGGTRNASRLGELPGGGKKAKEVGSYKDNMPMPSDAIKPVKFDKDTGGSHNVVEPGVAVKLGGKVKAVFDIVDRKVLVKMVENYESFGYNISLERVTPSWKKDAKLMGLLKESVNAKYNFAPQTSQKIRKAALQRFHALTKGSYNDLYESRQSYIETVKAAFTKIESLAESKYLDGLEIFECIARVKVEGVVADLEVITEATDHQMALRQVRNQIAEEYGFDSQIGHIIVDGKKYSPKKIVEYRTKR